MQDCLTAAILVSWVFSRVSLRKNATKPSIKVMMETLKLMRFIELLMIDFPFEDIVSQQTLPPWSTITPLWDDYCEKRCITQSIKSVTPLSVTPWHALHNGLEKFQALGRDQREINMYKRNGKRQGWSNSWRNIYYFVQYFDRHCLSSSACYKFVFKKLKKLHNFSTKKNLHSAWYRVERASYEK